MMKTAEQIMAKRTVFKTELDKRTSNSNKLWKKATEKLDEIMKHYGALPDGVLPHTILTRRTRSGNGWWEQLVSRSCA